MSLSFVKLVNSLGGFVIFKDLPGKRVFGLMTTKIVTKIHWK